MKTITYQDQTIELSGFEKYFHDFDGGQVTDNHKEALILLLDSLLLVNRATRPQFPDQSDKINRIKLEMSDKKASYEIESTHGQEKHYYNSTFPLVNSDQDGLLNDVLITAFVQTVQDYVEQNKDTTSVFNSMWYIINEIL